MKCESCGNELIGAAIICRACNHNNALHKRLAWRRNEPRHNQSTRPRASEPPAEFPTIVPRKDADVNLLHFPSALNKRAEASQAAAESEPQAATYPPWRAALKERVRLIKEKRATKEIVAPNPSPVQSPRDQVGETKLNQNQLVESALNRIRWAAREPERQSDREKGRRGERATEGQRDFSQSLPVLPSPRLPIAPSPRRHVPPVPRHSVPSALRSSSPLVRASLQISTSKPSVSDQLAGAPDTHVETRISGIAQALEPPNLKAETAPLRARLLAGVCDFEIVLTAFLPIFGAYATVNNTSLFSGESRLLMALLLSAVVFIYQIVMLAFAGRTFGMALLKLNMVNADDESLPVTLWRKALRALAATIVFICFPLYLAAWLSASRRTLPDLISGTTVAQQ